MIGIMDASDHSWADLDGLQGRLRALVSAQVELRAMLAELSVCAYRTGLHGASAPVLPSPDELHYVADVLGRASSCVRHAIVTARHGRLEDA